MKSLLIIFNGESNSGGFAPNTEAAPAELELRSSVRLLNPVSLQFEDLDIGANNLLDHAGLSLGTHGWELELANQADKTRFKKSPVYLMKTGQGGSLIDQWVGADQTYWNKFLDRSNAVKALLANTSYTPIVWYTQGINDAMAGTNLATWKTKTQQHFSKIREVFPGVKILFCQPPTESYNYFIWLPAISEVVQNDPNSYLISSANAAVNHPTNDPNHWSYSGIKRMAQRLINKTVDLLIPKDSLFSQNQLDRISIFPELSLQRREAFL